MQSCITCVFIVLPNLCLCQDSLWCSAVQYTACLQYKMSFSLQENYPSLRFLFRLRLALVPYIYTQAYIAYESGELKYFQVVRSTARKRSMPYSWRKQNFGGGGRGNYTAETLG